METKRNSTSVIWGLILIVLGLAFLADQFTAFSFGSVIGFAWPVLLIGLGIYLLVKSPSRPVGAIVLVLVGGIFLLGNFTAFNIFSLWPLILIGIGLSTLFSFRGRDVAFNTGSSVSNSNTFDNAVFFWGLDKKVVSEKFNSGAITAIFGGAKLDLREAKFDENPLLDITAIFGGVEILVPSDINVNCEGTGVFGGFDSRVSYRNEAKTTLSIRGQAIFGGVDIK